MKQKITSGRGYGKRPLWQWIIVYAIIAIAAYGFIYYYLFSKNGGYIPTSAQIYTPDALSASQPSAGGQNLRVISRTFLAPTPLDGPEVNYPVHVRDEKVSVNANGTIDLAYPVTANPNGLSPTDIKNAYHLPPTGGSGTIAIIDAYDYPNIESDLNVFSKQFGLPPCTTANGCFKKFVMGSTSPVFIGHSSIEISLDVEWAHAIAPNAKILLVIANPRPNSRLNATDMLAAVDYARKQPGVVAVSMSWGFKETSNTLNYDPHFTSANGQNVVFFAASGDSGNAYGLLWPSISSNVVSVGGTTLSFVNGQFSSETAWSGSGGGVSKSEPEPNYQVAYGIKQTGRAVPDVSYNADPHSGVSVYDSYGSRSTTNTTNWIVVGGTSAGAPQWAAIEALGGAASNPALYADASTDTLTRDFRPTDFRPTFTTHFRDIVSGTNGTCGFYCTAQPGYDYITGLGSPLTVSF